MGEPVLTARENFKEEKTANKTSPISAEKINFKSNTLKIFSNVTFILLFIHLKALHEKRIKKLVL